MRKAKKNTLKYTSIIGVSVLMLTGCMSTGKQSTNQPALTPEQLAQVNEARDAMLQRMKQSVANLKRGQNITSNSGTVKTTQPEPIIAISNDELIAKYNNIISTGNSAVFKVERDGISINDNMYIDAEGTVKRAGWNSISGHFTYAIETFDGSSLLKFHRAGSNTPPLEIATIDGGGANYRVTTVDGIIMVGNRYIPTSNGVIVTRGSSVFKYEIGQPLKSLSIPKGWNVAHYQKGDVDSTGNLLLERDAWAKKKEESKGTFGFGELVSAFKETQRTFGYAEIYDYALFDINNKNGTLLNMSIDDKTVSKHSNCRRQNDFVNKCDSVQSFESLYNSNGTQNRLHYYWSLDWFITHAGPIAVYNSGTKLLAVDIQGKQNLTLFERGAGVNSFSLKQNQNGKVSIDVVLGFSKDGIDDLNEYIINNMHTLAPTPTKTL